MDTARMPENNKTMDAAFSRSDERLPIGRGAVSSFEELLRCESESDATVRNYLSVLRAFVAFAEGQTETSPTVLVRRYITIKLQDKEASTVNLHRAALLKYYSCVEKLNLSDVPRRRQPKKLPKVISSFESILKAIDGTINGKHKLILQLFYACGLRLHEMKNLKKKNIRQDKNYLWLEDTKGLKHRIVPIPESVRGLLYSFVGEMGEEDLLFDLSARTFGKIVSSAFNRVGEHVHPHMLRHSFATHQIMSGQPIEKVQHWMGHGDIKTTMIYVHLSEAFLSQSTDLLGKSSANK